MKTKKTTQTRRRTTTTRTTKTKTKRTKPSFEVSGSHGFHVELLKNPKLSLILPALRGPDESFDGADGLKFSITARIRAIVFDHFPGSWNTDPMGPHTLEHVTGILQKLKATPDAVGLHFVDHLATAVRNTVNHPVWGGLGEALLKELLAAF